MTSLIGDSRRSIVPRLRQSSSFVRAPESGPISARDVVSMNDGWAETSFQEWRANPTAGHLADAFSAAIQERDERYIRVLALEIVKQGDKVPRFLQSIANSALLNNADESDSTNGIDLSRYEINILYRKVAALKDRISFSDHNSFLWHDLGFTYTLLGEQEKAKRAMSVALGLSGGHRLIVRSASRLYLHYGEPDRAKAILTESDGFKGDPWLLAAHVAISQSQGGASRYAKKARILFDSVNKKNSGLSELGMALATEEFLYGKSKSAKLLARQSRQDATENAMAQGEWLSSHLNIPLFDRKDELSHGAFEAVARDAFRRTDWDESMNFSLDWFSDQPFSSNAALFSSFVASTFNKRFDIAENVIQLALRSNPYNWMLRNNLVVSLAEQKKLKDAEKEFACISVPSEEDDEYSTWLATSGLLNYRNGLIEQARVLYERSYRILKERRDRSRQIVLCIYQVFEETNVGNMIKAGEIIRMVQKDLGLPERTGADLLNILANEIKFSLDV